MKQKIVTLDSEATTFISEVEAKIEKYLIFENQYKRNSLRRLERELEKIEPDYKTFFIDKIDEKDLWCDILLVLFNTQNRDITKISLLCKNILSFPVLFQWIKNELYCEESAKEDILVLINEILQYIDKNIDKKIRTSTVSKLSIDEVSDTSITINKLINELIIWIKNIIINKEEKHNKSNEYLYKILSETKNNEYEKQPLLIFYIMLQILIYLKQEDMNKEIHKDYSTISPCIVFSLLHDLYCYSYKKKMDTINKINVYIYYFGNELLKNVKNKYEFYRKTSNNSEEFKYRFRRLGLKYKKYIDGKCIFNGVKKHGNDDIVETRKYYLKMKGLLYGLSIVDCNYIDCIAKREEIISDDFYIELSKNIRNPRFCCCKNCNIEVLWPDWWRKTAKSKDEKQSLDYMEFGYFFWIDEYSKGKFNRIFNCKVKKIDRRLEEMLYEKTGFSGLKFRSAGPRYKGQLIESEEAREAFFASHGSRLRADGLAILYERRDRLIIDTRMKIENKIKDINDLETLLIDADSNKYNPSLKETYEKLNTYDSQMIRAFLRGEIDFLFTRTYKKLEKVLLGQKTEP